MKRLALVLALVLVATLLVACPAPVPEVVEREVQVTVEVEVEKEVIVTPTPVPPTPLPEAVTIHVMDWQSGGPAFWAKTDQLFNESHPWITVEHEHVPYGQYFDKVGAYLAAGEGPDLIQFETGVSILKYADALVPLNDHVQDILGDIGGASAFCEGFDCSNKIYGVPHTNQGHMMYYNKKVFEEAGLDPDNPPVTWREFDEACQKIKDIGKACIAYGGKEWAATWSFCNLPHQVASHEEQLGLLTGESRWDELPLQNTIALFEDMVKRGWLQEGAAMTAVTPDAQDMFVRGDAGFFHSIISDAFNWKLWGDLMGYANFGVMKYPQIECDFPLEGVCPGPLSTRMDLHGGIAFGVPTWSENVEAAVQYIKFVVGPETQTRFLLEGGAVPANQNFDQSVVTVAQFKTILEWMAEPDVVPPAALYMPPEGWNEGIRQFQLLILGETTVEAAAAAIEQAQEAGMAALPQ